jgi:hypothetical protein
MVGFQACRAYNMLAMMLDPCYKGLGLVINYVGKERALGIAGEYDMVVLFSLLVSTYKALNPNDVGDKGHNTSTSQGAQSTRLYDSLNIVKDKALSVAK